MMFPRRRSRYLASRFYLRAAWSSLATTILAAAICLEASGSSDLVKMMEKEGYDAINT